MRVLAEGSTDKVLLETKIFDEEVFQRQGDAASPSLSTYLEISSPPAILPHVFQTSDDPLAFCVMPSLAPRGKHIAR